LNGGWSEEKIKEDLASGSLEDILGMIAVERVRPEELEAARARTEEDVAAVLTITGVDENLDVAAVADAQLEQMKTIMTDCSIDLAVEQE
jgi:broad-specificity NMP kinase